jgi:hypothetical protein
MIDKQKQLEIILHSNPFNQDLGDHTWIKSVSDIKTYQEAWEEEGEIYGITPDFSKENAISALKNGIITVYSSYPIKQGIFVTPSKMEAQNYAGGNRVFSLKCNVDDIAWIDPTQGQYANVRIKEDKNMNRKLIRLTEGDLHRIVEESVNIILNEVGETEGGQEKLARLAARKSFNGDKSYFNISDYAKGKRN